MGLYRLGASKTLSEGEGVSMNAAEKNLVRMLEPSGHKFSKTS